MTSIASPAQTHEYAVHMAKGGLTISLANARTVLAAVRHHCPNSQLMTRTLGLEDWEPATDDLLARRTLRQANALIGTLIADTGLPLVDWALEAARPSRIHAMLSGRHERAHLATFSAYFGVEIVDVSNRREINAECEGVEIWVWAYASPVADQAETAAVDA